MTGDTENIVLSLLRDIRKEQAEQRSLLLDAFEYMRRIDSDVRRMTQRLEARISAVGTTHSTSKPETAGVRAGDLGLIEGLDWRIESDGKIIH